MKFKYILPTVWLAFALLMGWGDQKVDARMWAGAVKNPIIHAWFEKQHNFRKQWCCDISDGHILSDNEWRVHDDAYQVSVLGNWHAIPQDHLVDPAGGPNPTGAAVVWYNVYDTPEGPTVSIFCFTPGDFY